MFRRISQLLDRRGSVLGGFLGILLGLVIFLGMWGLAVGWPLLLGRIASIYTFIPERLGVLRLLSQEDLTTFDVVTPYEGILEIERAGSYALFTTIPETEFSSVSVWFAPTDEYVVSERDWYAIQARTVDIPGEFAAAFEAEKAGSYRILIEELPGGVLRTITLAPDYSSSNQLVFLLACLIQNAAVAGVVVLVYRRKNKQRLAEMATAKQGKKDRLAQWLEEEKKG